MGRFFASLFFMSRVEPQQPEQFAIERRSAPRSTPEKAEGEERTIDEALKNAERAGREDRERKE